MQGLFRPEGVFIAALTVCSSVFVAGHFPASAGDWAFTPSLGVVETFTDNANLATEGQEKDADIISRITPSFSLQGSGGRTSLNLNYSLSESLFHFNTGDDSFSQTLAATGSAELYEHVLSVESSATITRQIVDNTQASSNSIAGDSVNRTEQRTFNIAPVVRHKFGRWADTVSRTQFSLVSTGTNTVSDTKTITETLTVSSGREFSRLPWSLSAVTSKTIPDGGRTGSDRQNYDASVSYVLGPKLSLNGSIGYELVRDDTLDNSPVGMTWNVGFSAQPSRKTSITMSGGVRNDTINLSLQGNHQVSARTSVSASYSQTLQTSQSLAADNAAFLVTDPLTGSLVDSRTGEIFTGNDPFGLNDNTFRQDSFRLTFSGSRKRNTFSGNVSVERRDIEAENVVEMGYGAGLSLSRRLSTKANGSLGLSYNFTDFDTADGREQSDIGINAGLSYSLREDVSATLNYALTLRDVNNANDDLTENSINLGLTKSF